MSQLEGGRISGRQLAALFMVTRVFWGTIVSPILTSAHVGRDAWLAGLISSVAAIPFGLVVVKLGAMHPTETLIEYSRRLLGNPLGTFLGLLFVGYFLVLSAAGARALGEAYTTAFMPETPLVVFIAVTVGLGSLAARSGLEVVGRASENVIIIVVLIVLAILVMPVDRMKFTNLLPVLENGWRPVLEGTLSSFAFFAEVISVGMVLPYLNRPRVAASSVVWAIVLSGALITLPAVTVVALFGPQADSPVIPFLDQAMMISIANFLERLELLPLVVWTLMAWLKIGFYQWLAILGLAQVFHLSDYRPLAYPMGLVTSALALLLYRNLYDLIAFMEPGKFGAYGTFGVLGITGLLVILSVVRRGT